MEKDRILVVDDEQDLCEILHYALTAEGYQVDTALSPEEAMTLPLGNYSLFMLDVMMGATSGFDMAKILRNRPDTARTPIIFVTALDGEEDMVRGLDLGGDDYIAKPLSLRQVKARVRAVLRRTGAKGQKLTYGDLTLSLEDKTATLGEEVLQLTKLEFELLAIFLANPGRLFSRDALLQRCWPAGTVVVDRTVDVNIARLRKKIGQYGGCIKARFGYGYIFGE